MPCTSLRSITFVHISRNTISKLTFSTTDNNNNNRLCLILRKRTSLTNVTCANRAFFCRPHVLYSVERVTYIQCIFHTLPFNKHCAFYYFRSFTLCCLHQNTCIVVISNVRHSAPCCPLRTSQDTDYVRNTTWILAAHFIRCFVRVCDMH